MSASKANYPERPQFPRPKKPSKGNGRPSSNKRVGGKHKTWLSDGSVINNNNDVSPRRASASWFHAPMYKEARLKKWAD